MTVESREGRTEHEVTVTPRDLERYGRGREPEDVVRSAFEFLLEREPAGSILRRFELSEIERYFPEYARLS